MTQYLLLTNIPCSFPQDEGGVDSSALEEELILYQEQLPEEVLAANNLEADSMRVLSPVEMIQVTL